MIIYSLILFWLLTSAATSQWPPTNLFGIYLPAEPAKRRVIADDEGDLSSIHQAESPLISGETLSVMILRITR